MNPGEVVRRLKKFRPKYASDLAGILVVHQFDRGCFRRAYSIQGTRIVIKFPDGLPGVWHSRKEILRIKQIQRRASLRHLRRYLPKVYYADYKRGVLAMELLGNVGKVSKAECAILEHLAADTFKKIPSLTDILGDNVGTNARGQIKFVDFGCL